MKKLIVLFLNIISAIICTIVLCIVSVRYPNNDLINMAVEPTFFNSTDFTSICQEKLDTFFNYIALKQAFESFGILDNNKIIARANYDDNTYRDITINIALEEAKKYNISITNDYKVVFDVIDTIQDTAVLSFTNYYGKNIHTPTDTISLSQREFIITFMEDLANYRKYTEIEFSNKSNFKYILLYNYTSLDRFIFTNSSSSTMEELYDNNFIYINSVERLNTTNILNLNTNIISKIIMYNPLKSSPEYYHYTFSVLINNNLEYDDIFRKAKNNYDKEKKQSAYYLSLLLYSFIVFLITFVALGIIIFNTKTNINIQPNILTSIPIETHVLAYIIICILIYLIIGISKDSNIYLSNRRIRIYTYIVSYYIISIIFFFILSLKYESNTLTSEFIIDLKQDVNNQLKYFNKKGLFWFAIFPIFLLFAMGIYVFYTSVKLNINSISVIGLLLIGVAIAISIYLLLLFRSFTDTINEKNKSNELKSILISNISHDIKTPLTSIINYSEIIHRDLTNKKNINKDDIENITDYSSIIYDKSIRLNQLINDIIFDSKVTSGNLSFDMNRINIIEFIDQIILEFTPDLNESNLKISFTHPDTNTYIMADSEKLYRVFQNLFSNIKKYSLQNSMVFINLTNEKNKVKITIRNIQKDPIDADDLTLKERFWQGDESRSNTGFGLGLSITNSLIKAMNGKFTANASRDIFITVITFLNKK